MSDARIQKSGHIWLLRDDGKYECNNCKMVITRKLLEVMEDVQETQDLPKCKGQKTIAKIPFTLHKKLHREPIINSKLKELFVNNVVTFEQLQPFIKNDGEEFWEGKKDEKGMFSFLQDNGFEIIPCYKKGEKSLTEIYVNFEKLQKAIGENQPTLEVSEPAKQLEHIEAIKTFAIKLGQETTMDKIEISSYRENGFKIVFNKQINENAKKTQILQSIAEERNLDLSPFTEKQKG